MKTQRHELESTQYEDFRLIPTNGEWAELALCRSFATRLLRGNDESIELSSFMTIAVSFNRRPFKGSQKVFVRVDRNAYETVRYGIARHTADDGYVYGAVRDILLPFFPKDGTFSLYLKATNLPQLP